MVASSTPLRTSVPRPLSVQTVPPSWIITLPGITGPLRYSATVPPACLLGYVRVSAGPAATSAGASPPAIALTTGVSPCALGTSGAVMLVTCTVRSFGAAAPTVGETP